MMAGKLRITLIRSPIARCRQHRRILRALGLTRIGQQVEHNNSLEISGMIAKVDYLLRVEETKAD